MTFAHWVIQSLTQPKQCCGYFQKTGRYVNNGDTAPRKSSLRVTVFIHYSVYVTLNQQKQRRTCLPLGTQHDSVWASSCFINTVFQEGPKVVSASKSHWKSAVVMLTERTEGTLCFTMTFAVVNIGFAEMRSRLVLGERPTDGIVFYRFNVRVLRELTSLFLFLWEGVEPSAEGLSSFAYFCGEKGKN